jgi:glutamate synthase (NADPH/NADH) small chain
MVLQAVGQLFDATPIAGAAAVPAMENGRIAVDADGLTSIPMVYAGGDCTPGPDLTVSAVQDGKLAALAIHAALATGAASAIPATPPAAAPASAPTRSA